MQHPTPSWPHSIVNITHRSSYSTHSVALPFALGSGILSTPIPHTLITFQQQQGPQLVRNAATKAEMQVLTKQDTRSSVKVKDKEKVPELSRVRVMKRFGINTTIMPNNTDLVYGKFGIRAITERRVAANTIEAIRR